MGRPIKRVNFGNTTTAGSQIQVSGFVTGGSAKTGYIVAQKSSRRYKVTTADGTEVLRLVTGVPGAGEMTITATRSADHSKYGDSSTFKVAKLTSRLAYDADGYASQWGLDTAADEVVQLASA